MKNAMLWSEIAPRFNKLNVTPPPTIQRTTPSLPLRTELPLFNIWLATHARINEIKTGLNQVFFFCVYTFVFLITLPKKRR